ncbi:MAG: threonine synthase, partial [Alphaproteobacteria bacterium]|nr:threonine synthase [Alphaproteobacteria bacterium]
MRYLSTRGAAAERDFSGVLLTGLAEDGGLWQPGRWPRLDEAARAPGAGYAARAFAVTRPFVAGGLEEEDWRALLADVYAGFRHPAVAPLVQLDANLWLMELFHGPTFAFKDLAMQALGRLFDLVLKARGERITIIGATSGDTGAAAVEAVRGLETIDLVMLYPHGR